MNGILLLIFGALITLVFIAHKILSLLKQRNKIEAEDIFIDEKKNLENWTLADRLIFLRSKNISKQNNTLYPLFSEYDLAWQQLGREIALRKAGSYEEQVSKTKEEEINEWVNKHGNEKFTPSDHLKNLIKELVEQERKMKKEEIRLRAMIEANISILNGAKIQATKADFDKQFDFPKDWNIENIMRKQKEIEKEINRRLENIIKTADEQLKKLK